MNIMNIIPDGTTAFIIYMLAFTLGILRFVFWDICIMAGSFFGDDTRYG